MGDPAVTAKFKPRRGLDQTIAEKIAQPTLRRVIDMLTDEAKHRARATKVWISARDERVRPTHVDADTQNIPANLRFILDKVDGTGKDLGRHPRDGSFTAANRYGCRCVDVPLPHPLRESIHSSNVRVSDTVAHGEVETRFPRAAESEFGTSEDRAAHYFTGALNEVAARLRSGHSR
jgi:hypothetical protein